MGYRNYAVEDFVLDPQFRKWVLNPDEELDHFWKGWLAEHPEKADFLREARELINDLSGLKNSMDDQSVDTLWQSIEDQIDSGPFLVRSREKVISLPATPPPRRGKILSYQNAGKLAASVLIFFCIGLSLYLAKREGAISLPELVKHENSFGKRSTIFLSDGTEVILNAGSSIEYFKAFSANERRVELKGEAFFKVARDAQRPFKVISGGIITEALGTSFNVQAYNPELIKIALVTGKVSIDKVKKGLQATKMMILHPGEEAQYSLDSGLAKRKFEPKDILSWTEGIIFFKNAKEFEVINTLERWYGVKIEKRNQSKKEWDYTASFKNQSLEHVLMSIGYAMDFEFEINQKSVLVKYK